jgi:hypothetical protein
MRRSRVGATLIVTSVCSGVVFLAASGMILGRGETDPDYLLRFGVWSLTALGLFVALVLGLVIVLEERNPRAASP